MPRFSTTALNFIAAAALLGAAAWFSFSVFSAKDAAKAIPPPVVVIVEQPVKKVVEPPVKKPQ